MNSLLNTPIVDDVLPFVMQADDDVTLVEYVYGKEYEGDYILSFFNYGLLNTKKDTINWYEIGTNMFVLETKVSELIYSPVSEGFSFLIQRLGQSNLNLREVFNFGNDPRDTSKAAQQIDMERFAERGKLMDKCLDDMDNGTFNVLEFQRQIKEINDKYPL